MSSAYVFTIQLISAFSLILNAYFVNVYTCCHLKNTKFKYFFLLSALQNIAFSTALILITPFVVIKEFSLLYIAVGPLCRESSGGQLLMCIFLATYIFSIMLISNSFVYRYFLVGRAYDINTLLTCRNTSISLTINGFFFINWCLCAYVVFWPVPPFSDSLREVAIALLGITEDHAATSAKVGFSLKFNVSPANGFLLGHIIMMMACMAIIVKCSAYQIQAVIRNAAVSNVLKKMYRQTLILLVMQRSKAQKVKPQAVLPCFSFDNKKRGENSVKVRTPRLESCKKWLSVRKMESISVQINMKNIRNLRKNSNKNRSRKTLILKRIGSLSICLACEFNVPIQAYLEQVE